MANRRKPPFQRGRNFCIFCDTPNPKITREHIWPQWVRPYIPIAKIRNPKSKHITAIHSFDGQFPVTALWLKSKLARNGEAIDQKLKIVCNVCNNGWMSVLQEQSKKILLPLILKSENIWLNKVEQSTISFWAMMFTMVIEFADPKTIAIPKLDRQNFRISRQMPKVCHIFIGRNSGNHTDFFHRAIGVHENETPKFPDQPFNMQITTFTVGAILFQVITCHDMPDADEIDEYLNEYGPALRLQRIWPNQENPVNLPNIGISYQEFVIVATSLSKEVIQVDHRWLNHTPPIVGC